MHSHSGKNDVLINASIAARRARDQELEKGLKDQSLIELFNAILDHAFLLPLMELKLNQCTSFQGGQILTLQNLAQPYCFSSTKPLIFGKTFIALELTEIGENEFRHAFEHVPNGRHLAYFEDTLSSYSCVDAGTGICGTQSFVERAITLGDHALIERMVDAETGAYYFPSDELAKLSAMFGPTRELGHPSTTRSGVVDLASKRIL
jgi:hypothetical protein